MCICQGASAICFVVGSMDKRFTVWVEGCNKPWIVTDKKLFDKPILDIAWSPDGKHIFAVTECGKLGHCLFMVSACLSCNLSAHDMRRLVCGAPWCLASVHVKSVPGVARST